ncbi:MAG: TonB C-terminal domain-containing protein [Candidatus Gastranaerophilales bacterium]|nr:TonB C-terminal domain-containing protein [Candidatus Gastranaerophilales bacterium]
MTKLTIAKEDKNIDIEVLAPIMNDYSRNNIYLANLICKAFSKNYNLHLDTSTSVFNLPIVNFNLSIIDCKINGLKAAFVPTVNRASNKYVHIPVDYRDYKYTPDVIIFVNFSKTLSKLEILGFIPGHNVSTSSIEKSMLKAPDELKEYLNSQSPASDEVSPSSLNTAEELMLAYIDGDLSAEGARFFQKYILMSDTLRKNYKMFYALNCDFISIAQDSEIDKKITLMQSASSAPAVLNKETDFGISPGSGDLKDFSLGSLTFSIEAEEDLPAAMEDLPAAMEEISYETEESNAEQPVFPDEKIPESPINEEEMLDFEDAAPPETLSDTDITEDLAQEENILNSFEDEENLLDFSAVDDLIIDEDNSFDDEIIEDNITFEEETNAQDETDISDMGDVDLDFEADDLDLLELDEQDVNAANSIDIDNPEFVTEDNAMPEAAEANEPVISAGEDDIFNMLSDLADKPVSSDAIEQLDDEALGILMQDDNDTEEILSNEPEAPQQEEVNTAPHEEETPSTREYVNVYSPEPQPKKSNLVTLLIFGALLLGMVAYAGLMYKDEIAMIINPDSAIESSIPEAQQPPSERLPEPVANNQGEPAPATPPAVNQPIASGHNEELPPAATAPQVPGALKTPEKAPSPQNINDAIATAITKEYSAVRISKTSWEAPEALVANAEFKKYLTLTGRSIKTTLSQELLLANEKAPNNEVSVAITYSDLGSVISAKIVKSSGSKQVDDIIISSINETLNYTKMPAMKINKKEYTIKLVITL